MTIPSTMLKVVVAAPRQVALHEVAVPDPAADEVLIRLAYVGVSGSDLRGYRGTLPTTVYPVVPGLEVSGTVARVGASVANVQVGDRVIVEPVRSCGQCRACKAGRYNCCRRVQVWGIQMDGAMAEFATAQANRVFRIPDSLPLSTAILCEPLSIGMQGGGASAGGARRGCCRPGWRRHWPHRLRRGQEPGSARHSVGAQPRSPGGSAAVGRRRGARRRSCGPRRSRTAVDRPARGPRW